MIISGASAMKSRLDRALDVLIIVALTVLIIGHLLNWGRSGSAVAPSFDDAPIATTEQHA
jgi:hypothetical protein